MVPERTISEAPQPVSQNTHSMKHDGSALMSPPQVRASAGTVGREIELKLHVAPSDLARLARHPALVGLQQGTAASTRLYTVYFDTPDLRLASFGVALRVRRQGAQYIQTVKTLGGGNSGDAAAVAVRREWDWPITGEDPDISLLTLDGIRDLVPQDALPEIRPLFTTDFQRTTLMLRPDPLTAIEVALDTGEIRAGTTYRPISEIELELKAGPVTALFDLARELQQIVPMRISADNKALAGFALVTGRLPEPAKASPLGLTPAATVADGFRHIVRNCMSHVLANEACVLAGGNDEGIHQMRVALRRLRSAFGLFDDIIASGDAKALKDEVRWLMDRLGPARDWDILYHGFFQPFAEKRGHDDAVKSVGTGDFLLPPFRPCPRQRSAVLTALYDLDARVGKLAGIGTVAGERRSGSPGDGGEAVAGNGRPMAGRAAPESPQSGPADPEAEWRTASQAADQLQETALRR